MTSCDQIDNARDYALDELAGPGRALFEQHLTHCGDCAAEIERLRIASGALRLLSDREIPQRIAFVSDKIFAPSPVARFFSRFWRSGARLGFASACVLAAGLIVSAYRRPAEPGAAVTPPSTALIRARIDEEVNAAVARAFGQVRAEDAKASEAALKAAEARHEKQYRALMIAMEESMTVLEKRLSTVTMLASNDEVRFGNAQ